MDVQDSGVVQLTSLDEDKLEKAKEFVTTLIADRGGGRGGRDGGGGRGERAKYAGPPPVIGKTYEGKIMGVHKFGVFVEILPGAEDGSTPGLEGLCHVSELHIEHVRNCEGFIKGMNTEQLKVRVLGWNDGGKLQLSRKSVLQNSKDEPPPATNDEPNDKSDAPEAMSQEEVDVIAAAIDGLLE
mmetsp:Transcript_1769/g.2599  ORF Transcript_1769/g.2599 Transcript_1769/m.2599 type:complete len:184 (+) Transcript_1769:2248-2799(+)